MSQEHPVSWQQPHSALPSPASMSRTVSYTEKNCQLAFQCEKGKKGFSRIPPGLQASHYDRQPLRPRISTTNGSPIRIVLYEHLPVPSLPIGHPPRSVYEKRRHVSDVASDANCNKDPNINFLTCKRGGASQFLEELLGVWVLIGWR